MPLTPTTALKSSIKSSLIAEGFDISQAPMLNKFVDVFVDALISHITTNALVSTTVAGTLTPPTAVAGTGTGGIS